MLDLDEEWMLTVLKGCRRERRLHQPNGQMDVAEMCPWMNL